MASQYQPRRFFRHAPHRLLKRYFAERKVLFEVDFGALTETQVEPIYDAWLKLSDDARKDMEQDFQDIDELATEGGSKAILDEARWYGEDLAEQFGALNGFLEHSFWTFLKRPNYCRGALAFHQADLVPASYWRKRKNVPPKSASVDDASESLWHIPLRHRAMPAPSPPSQRPSSTPCWGSRLVLAPKSLGA